MRAEVEAEREVIEALQRAARRHLALSARIDSLGRSNG